jgi:hypothetical protein
MRVLGGCPRRQIVHQFPAPNPLPLLHYPRSHHALGCVRATAVKDSGNVEAVETGVETDSLT